MSEAQPLQIIPLDYEIVQEDYPDRWKRANPGQASIEKIGDGHWYLELEDGDDEHHLILGEKGDTFYGFCDCDGYSYQTKQGNGPCAHLCTLLKLTVTDEIEVPDVDDLEAQAGSQPDVDDRDRDDVVDEPTTESGGEPVPPESSSLEQREIVADTPDASEIEDPEQFVEEIAGVPQAFVITMGKGKTKKPYVTKEGLNYLAHKQGIETRAEPVSPTWEGDPEISVFKGIAIDSEGRRYEDYSKKQVSEVESTVGEENLDEMASTQATNRALRLATGCGFASIEEVNGESFVDEPDPADPDVVDAEVVEG